MMTFKISTHGGTRLYQLFYEIPTETVLEGLCKSKLQDSVQLQTVLAVYEQENVRNNEPPNNSRLKTILRRHLD